MTDELNALDAVLESNVGIERVRRAHAVYAGLRSEVSRGVAELAALGEHRWSIGFDSLRACIEQVGSRHLRAIVREELTANQQRKETSHVETET